MEDPASGGNISHSDALVAGESSRGVQLDYQAYQLLHWGFAVLPILAGLDKFATVLCNWSKYLAPQIGGVLGPDTTMQIVGVIEVLAGIGVAIKPRLIAPVVAVWLWAIIINLILLGGYYDIALRDFGLSLGALGLWRLSQHFESSTGHSREQSS